MRERFRRATAQRFKRGKKFVRANAETLTPFLNTVRRTIMTADDARALVAESKLGDRAAAQAWLEAWNRAIEYAAKHGKTFVREGSVSKPRTTGVSAAARESALDALRSNGFEVKEAADGPNEMTLEVSW